MKPDTLRKLAALGLTTEQIAGVMEVMEADADEGKEKARARWRKWKANQSETNVGKRLQTDTNVSKQLVPDPAHVEDNLLPKKISGQEENKKDRPQAAKTPRSELLVVLDAERADALIEHRQRLRKPMTAHAAHLLAGKLSQCPNPNEAADAIIANGWQGFEVSWLDKPKPRSGAPPNGRMSAVETNIARRMRKDEPGSGRRDNGDAELLSPDKPELRNLIRDAGQAMRIPDGSGHH